MKHPIVLNIPHSSADVPVSALEHFSISREKLWRETILLTDWHTEKLFDLPGTHKIIAPVSRLVVDTERYIDDNLEPNAAHGMGVIYERDCQGAVIRSIGHEERQSLLEEFYDPHHRALEDAVQACLDEYGVCLLVDCHSFPSEPFPFETPEWRPRPDICIGTTPDNSDEELLVCVESFLRENDLKTNTNYPYSGCLIPEKFIGDPRVKAFMLEVNRNLYLNESSMKYLSAGEIPALRKDSEHLRGILHQLIYEVSAGLDKDKCKVDERGLRIHIGSPNEAGCISNELQGYIFNEFKKREIPVISAAKGSGCWNNQNEECLEVLVPIDVHFRDLFSLAQAIRAELDQEAIGISNNEGTYLRITQDTLLCEGNVAVLNRKTLKEKAGYIFDPKTESMSTHKDFHYVSFGVRSIDGMADRFFTWMPMRLNGQLECWELFKLGPYQGEGPVNYPDWIGAVIGIDSQTWLIWHPNSDVEANGPYIQDRYGCTPSAPCSWLS